MELGAEELLRANHDCYEHLEFVDDSFDHEYGTEVIRYNLCTVCGLMSEPSDYDFDEY